MGSKEMWAKLRPTAFVFALIMAWLVWTLIKYVLGGSLGASAFGDPGQAASIITAALIVVGAAVGALGSALLKLSEDGPPTQVPESSVLALIEALKTEREGSLGMIVENVEGNRPRENLDEG